MNSSSGRAVSSAAPRDVTGMISRPDSLSRKTTRGYAYAPVGSACPTRTVEAVPCAEVPTLGFHGAASSPGFVGQQPSHSVALSAFALACCRNVGANSVGANSYWRMLRPGVVYAWRLVDRDFRGTGRSGARRESDSERLHHEPRAVTRPGDDSFAESVGSVYGIRQCAVSILCPAPGRVGPAGVRQRRRSHHHFT